MSKSAEYLGYYPEAELVLGIVCAIGTDYQPVLKSTSNYLKHFGYETTVLKLSDRFNVLLETLGESPQIGNSEAERMHSKIQAGNRIRELTNKPEIMALVAAEEIASRRSFDSQDNPEPLSKTAHIIVSLKRPEEVNCLRRIYGAGFYLIGIAADEDARAAYLTARKRLSESERERLIDIDANELKPFGQQTRNTFYLSDVFVSLDHHESELKRFLYLAFGCPTETPNLVEHSMYLAYAASLRSGDLSRQVGAALVDSHGDLLGVGCNDVPTYGGGLYWPGPGSARDIDYKIDANDAEKMDMALKIMELINPSASEDERRRTAREVLKPTGFFDITEFGRAVHAEMDALLSCARTGRSPRGSTLYTTTFPCHNCTRHIIAAGIQRVVYIEPYAKSKAFSLHQDAISNNENRGFTRLPFVPFIGVGPRRYLDLFSLSLGTGIPIERKHDGVLIDWNPAEAGPRLQMQPSSYLTRESFASASLRNILESSKSIE